jgi:hypothetical protein
MTLALYIMAPEPIPMAYFINLSHQSVCLYVSRFVVRQRTGKNVTTSTNTHAATKELLDASFRMRSVQYASKAGDSFFPELLIIIIIIIILLLLLTDSSRLERTQVKFTALYFGRFLIGTCDNIHDDIN